MPRRTLVLALLLGAAVTMLGAPASGRVPPPPRDVVNLLPARPYAPLPASATTAPSGRAVKAQRSTVPVPASPARTIRAGVSVVDATWKVGASAGQYASDGTSVGAHGFDPHGLSSRRVPSYGIQSRSDVRALVIEGVDGRRVAFATDDLYLAQDLLNQRVSAILKEHDERVRLGLSAGPPVGIDDTNLMVGASHNHSSPYYSAIAWGVWAFQDVFDLRYFEYVAQRLAQAIREAAADLRPARVAAATAPFDHTQRHSFGPAVGDDGTPAGYPQRDNDLALGLVRLDDISDRARPKPLAHVMTLGQHPEFLEGNNLLSGEFGGYVKTMVDTTVGAPTLFFQNQTGTAEPDTDGKAHAPAVRAEFSHREYAQAERGARQIANAVVSLSNAIGAGRPPVPEAAVGYRLDPPVSVLDRQFAPPYSHPFPTVSNCRTHEAAAGNPGVPVVGLPDCDRQAGALTGPVVGELEGTPLDPGVTFDELKDAGVPIPENYSAPSYTGLQETLQVHLQVFRIGDVLLTVCPCEQWADQSRNIKSRADRVQGNVWLGWDWTALCHPTSNDQWRCPNPGSVANYDRNPAEPPADGTLTISDAALKRIRAQVRNDAAGWDDLAGAATAESEPADPAKIKGNFTHTEVPPALGYDLVLPIGMANDYWGYIASYREYSRGDHYRKALTGLGPHSADFFATRLVAMGALLKGAPAGSYWAEKATLDAHDQAYAVDGAHQEARVRLLGQAAAAYLPAYEAQLPPDGGTARVVTEPQSITRFDVAQMTWVGGSNYVDDPQVRVERLVGTRWVTAGDMHGDVVVTLDYPDVPAGAVAFRTGSHEWRWTAHFEAFSSDIDTARGPQTPAGLYRFVVDGKRREGVPATTRGYHLESATFQIRPWDGIVVRAAGLDAQGRPTFTVGEPGRTKKHATHYPGGEATLDVPTPAIDYPDSWPAAKLPAAAETGDTAFPRLERTLIAGSQRYCFSCTFRPWADGGVARAVTVELTDADGTSTRVAAHRGADGRWHLPRPLAPGQSARVAPGGVIDDHGETNGQGSAIVATGRAPLPATGAAPALPILGAALLLLTVSVLAPRRPRAHAR